MTKPIDTGGPAYPQYKADMLPHNVELVTTVSGMTWLDYAAIEIAAKFSVAAINIHELMQQTNQTEYQKEVIGRIVGASYLIAQALLARKREIEKGEA